MNSDEIKQAILGEAWSPVAQAARKAKHPDWNWGGDGSGSGPKGLQVRKPSQTRLPGYSSTQHVYAGDKHLGSIHGAHVGTKTRFMASRPGQKEMTAHGSKEEAAHALHSASESAPSKGQQLAASHGEKADPARGIYAASRSMASKDDAEALAKHLNDTKAHDGAQHYATTSKSGGHMVKVKSSKQLAKEAKGIKGADPKFPNEVLKKSNKLHPANKGR